MRLLLLLTVVLGVVACADPATTLRPPHTSAANPSQTKAPAALASPTLLVWAHGKDATRVPATTFRLESNGEVVDRSPGVRIATSRGEWTWTTRREPVATESCDFDTPIPPQESWVTSATLVGPGGVEQPIVRIKPDAEGANELHHQVDLLASLGPLVFVEQTTWSYSCGAHGADAKEFLVWDVERARPLDVLPKIPAADTVIANAQRELDRTSPGGPFGASTPEITELFPVLRGDRLHFDAQVTVPSCYACGDGLWSSYTRSVRVAARPPPEIARQAWVPHGVLAFAKAHPDLAVGGWSRAPE